MTKSQQPSASTGPRSAEGKARSSMNALKSGIYSKSLTIPGENPAHLDTLRDEYFQARIRRNQLKTHPLTTHPSSFRQLPPRPLSPP